MNDKCLGENCRWFNDRHANCFNVGVLPHCSSTLKSEMKELVTGGDIKVKNRTCKYCGKVTQRTLYGICSECGKFQ